jgi:chromosome segregation ATPase
MRQMDLQVVQQRTEVNGLHSRMRDVVANQGTVQEMVENAEAEMRVVNAEVDGLRIQLAAAEERITTNVNNRVDAALEQMSSIHQTQLDEIIGQLKDDIVGQLKEIKKEQGNLWSRVVEMLRGRSSV